ncbi:hypothetical protein GA0115239_102938 [Streptomyces sp. BpilaLS-43]|nr:hypothetical protein GA0115239_102938 [Streptomyces sp. BpilaLS-43]
MPRVGSCGGELRGAGVGRARPVRAGGVRLGAQGGQQLVVVAVPPGAAVQSLLPAPVGVALQVLVVAAPQDQRGVRGEPDEVLADLGGHLVVQRLLLRVGGAGEGEVLPDQQPLLVAEFVEVVALVETAAPDADQVGVRGEGLVQAVGESPPGEAGREAVVRDPVHASYEDRLAVDGDPERLALQGDAPEAGPASPGVLTEVDGDVVQGLLAVAVRPPDLGVGDREGEREAVLVLRGDEDGAPAEHLDRARHRRAAVALHVQGDGQARHPGLVEVAQHLDGGDAVAAPGLQGDRAPDAGGDQGRAPVPAEVAGRLADEGVRLGVRARPVAQPLAQRLGVGVRGGEADVDGVGALAQQRADREAVAPVLVGGRADLGAVEQDGGDGVEAVEAQVGGRVPVLGPFEGGAVGPVGTADPAEACLVVVHIGVVDQPGGQQVGVDAAGHGRRDALGGELHGHGAVGDQGPAVVQGQVAKAHVRFLPRATKRSGSVARSKAARQAPRRAHSGSVSYPRSTPHPWRCDSRGPRERVRGLTTGWETDGTMEWFPNGPRSARSLPTQETL